MKKVIFLNYSFSLSFYNDNMVKICFLTSKYFAENISVIHSMFMSKKHSFSHFLAAVLYMQASVQVILVHFTIFSIVRVFLAFKSF